MINLENKVTFMNESNKFRGYQGSIPDEYGTMDETIKEASATIEGQNNGSDGMSSENMNILFDEIKKDMREREDRSRKEITDREERFEKTMQSYADAAKERELRYRDDSKEREDRITEIARNIEIKTNESARHIENMKTQNFWGNIALFVGMLAIVVTLIIVV